MTDTRKGAARPSAELLAKIRSEHARCVEYGCDTGRVFLELDALTRDLDAAREALAKAEAERDRARAELGAICAAATVRPGEEFCAVYGAATEAVRSILNERDAAVREAEALRADSLALARRERERCAAWVNDQVDNSAGEDIREGLHWTVTDWIGVPAEPDPLAPKETT